MNYKTTLLIFIVVLFFQDSNAQGTRLGVGLGYATWDLESLKQVQEDALRYNNLNNIKATESFPNRLFGSFFFGYEFKNKSSLNFYYSYYSTGGRNAVSDYSGSYKLDMELEASKYGLCYDFNKPLTDKLSIGGLMGTGVLLSKYDINESLYINGSPRYDFDQKFEGLNIFIEPNLVLTYNIIDQLNCLLKVGYEKNITNNLHLKGDKESISSLDADWSGIRISTGVHYTFRSE